MSSIKSSCPMGWIIDRTVGHISSNKERLLKNFFGEGNGSPLQHSCLENPMDGHNHRKTMFFKNLLKDSYKVSYLKDYSTNKNMTFSSDSLRNS